MFNKVLVPLDGSELAEAVLPHVIELTKHCSMQITLLQVLPSASQMLGLTGTTELGPMVATDPDTIRDTFEAEKQKAQDYMNGVAEGLREQGLNVVVDVFEGSVGSTIVQFARDEGVDLIALSTHGRSGLGRLVFGSVADHVLRRSGLPILLIKPDKKGEAEH